MAELVLLLLLLLLLLPLLPLLPAAPQHQGRAAAAATHEVWPADAAHPAAVFAAAAPHHTSAAEP
jgi:hypothetical protein